MVNRISAPGLERRPYFHRYTDDSVDLCDVFGSYSPGAKVKLDEICKILGLPGKPEGIDGSQVEEMVKADKIPLVSQYCETDVLNTYRLWLIYELFRGTITPDQLAFSEVQARQFVSGRTNPHLLLSVGLGGKARAEARHRSKNDTEYGLSFVIAGLDPATHSAMRAAFVRGSPGFVSGTPVGQSRKMVPETIFLLLSSADGNRVPIRSFAMKNHVLALTTSAFVLVFGAMTATAQQGPMMQQQPHQQQSTQNDPEGMMGGGMMGRGMMGRGVMSGMMGHHGGMGGHVALRIIFALMDSDGDGTISLQEWQAAHERIFKAMDADKDGTVSFEEMINFMHGTPKGAPQR